MSQINHVENPIINTPFVAPKFHWHLEKGKQPEKREGRRIASREQYQELLASSM